jgi:hypothetical protein
MSKLRRSGTDQKLPIARYNCGVKLGVTRVLRCVTTEMRWNPTIQIGQ